jgi:hypothetical protein
VLTIPVSVNLNPAKWEIGTGNFLAGVLLSVTIVVNHHRLALLVLEPGKHKPICSSNFIKIAGCSVHKPISARIISQVHSAMG